MLQRRRRLLDQPAFWIGILVAVGMVQYMPAAFTQSPQEAVYWRLLGEDGGGSGPLRYGKDVALLFFGAYWPLFVIRRADPRVLAEVTHYAVWLLVVVSAGLIAHASGVGHPPLISAGLRWLLLLHGAYGITVMLRDGLGNAKPQRIAVNLLLVLSIVDIFLVLRQAGTYSLLGGRIPGGFSLAGTAGYFSLSGGIIAHFFAKAPLERRLALLFCMYIIAITSGTRFSIIGLAAISAVWAFQKLYHLKNSDMKSVVILLFMFIFVPLIIVGGFLGVNSAGRGNPFNQSGNGGRLDILNALLQDIPMAPMSEILFGNGLGTGTNLGFSMVEGRQVSRWHFLTDNTYEVAFFQFGLIGFLIFLVPVFLCILRRGKYNILYTFIVLLATFTQNMFEQYFLMLTFPICLFLRAPFQASRFRSSQLGRTRRRMERPMAILPVASDANDEGGGTERSGRSIFAAGVER